MLAPTTSVPLPLLITGVAGVPGYNAFRYFRKLYGDQVIGTRRCKNWPLSGPGIEPCDTEDAESMFRLWQKYRFASVLNCVGSCRLKSCQLDPAMAYRVNVQGTASLIRHVMKHDATFVHLSSDLVFAGRMSGAYQETDPPNPVTVYGQTMVQCEQLIRQQLPDATLLRISLPMGVSFNGHAGAIDWIQSRFQKGRPATLYYDEVRTPTYTQCMNRLFEFLLAHPVAGTFHSGGPRSLTLYQIGQIVNRVGGYPPELLKGCMRIEAGPMPPRAGNVTLDSTKLTSILGTNPFMAWPQGANTVPTDSTWHEIRHLNDPGSADQVSRKLYQNVNDPSPIPERNYAKSNL